MRESLLAFQDTSIPEKVELTREVWLSSQALPLDTPSPEDRSLALCLSAWTGKEVQVRQSPKSNRKRATAPGATSNGKRARQTPRDSRRTLELSDMTEYGEEISDEPSVAPTVLVNPDNLSSQSSPSALLEELFPVAIVHESPHLHLDSADQDVGVVPTLHSDLMLFASSEDQPLLRQLSNQPEFNPGLQVSRSLSSALTTRGWRLSFEARRGRGRGRGRDGSRGGVETADGRRSEPKARAKEIPQVELSLTLLLGYYSTLGCLAVPDCDSPAKWHCKVAGDS